MSATYVVRLYTLFAQAMQEIHVQHAITLSADGQQGGKFTATAMSSR